MHPDLVEGLHSAVGRSVVEVQDSPGADDAVLAGSLGREEAVVARLREVLPARLSILQHPSLAVVSDVAVPRMAVGGEGRGGEGRGGGGGAFKLTRVQSVYMYM